MEVQVSASESRTAAAGLPEIRIDLIGASHRSDDFPQDWDDDRGTRSLLRYRKIPSDSPKHE